ncbi:MAG: hypothetical protein CSA55_05275 [Ilumatobacter coccineus]|uniref:DUF1015 domain-containing protein n=1 Tax=Ilumatobacter coccineus TaxID=467094 RepID=A0A2G6K7K5_9ACTN|nr:MAG: hypothetical protein CSA55_05275 [Ilumatobacter coccineus]
MPRFEPFAALRYASDSFDATSAPPYDVISPDDVAVLRRQHPHNVVHIDAPAGGDDRYDHAAAVLRTWIDAGVLIPDPSPTFSLYRMHFTDASGAERHIVGVLGALDVNADSGVFPHERVTPKASTDRLNLMRSTQANLSPVWGLSLASGLAQLLAEPGELMGSMTVDGVTHEVERVTDPDRIAAIAAKVSDARVVIADGHHRYGVARRYRDEMAAQGRASSSQELTLALITELVDDQLSVAPIHRIYRSITADDLIATLSTSFDLSPADRLDPTIPAEMRRRGALYLLTRQGAWWLTPHEGVFDDLRPLDGLWLEHVLGSVSVDYQHGLEEVERLMASDVTVTAAVLTRPVGVEEIRRTALEGVLMPPKSTFVVPKPRTGAVIRLL